MAQESRPGRLMIVSGPSGAGKSTVLRKVLAKFSQQLKLSVSATTRAPRPGEQDGKDYYFLSPKEFARRRAAGDFLESCEVFGRGHWYGTLRSEVGASLAAGFSVVLEIDVAGAAKALQHYPDAVTIFVRPGSLEELERRLRDRATEDEASIQNRLAVAEDELRKAGNYQYHVINDTVESAVSQFVELLVSEGLV